MVGELTAIFLFAELLRFFSSHSSTIPFLTFTFFDEEFDLCFVATVEVEQSSSRRSAGTVARVCKW